MARKTIEVVIDDLTGEALDGDGRTVTFSYRNKKYSLDLSEANLEKFEQLLVPYIKAAHSTGGRRSRGSDRTKVGYDPQAVRKWAQSNGVALSARGRVPASVVAQYQAAGN